MFKIYLSRTINPGVGISPPATIEEVRKTYFLLDGTDTIPLETATAYVESFIPDLRQYLYEVPVSEKKLEELNYLAYHMKWMGNQNGTVLGTVTEMMKPETLQDMISLSYNMDKLRYLPSATTEIKLGEYLLKGNADTAMEKQVTRSNCEGIGRDYIRKHNGMSRAFGYINGIQEELEPIYRGGELPDPDFKQICSFKVWICKGNPYDNYTLSLPATKNRMDALKSAMGISNWSEYK